MKNVYAVWVYEYEISKMDSVLNRFQIGVNDRDRSRVLDINGCKIVNYTIICDNNVFNSILNIVNDWH